MSVSKVRLNVNHPVPANDNDDVKRLLLEVRVDFAARRQAVDALVEPDEHEETTTEWDLSEWDDCPTQEIAFESMAELVGSGCR